MPRVRLMDEADQNLVPGMVKMTPPRSAPSGPCFLSRLPASVPFFPSRPGEFKDSRCDCGKRQGFAGAA